MSYISRPISDNIVGLCSKKNLNNKDPGGQQAQHAILVL
jgi:hypothetical protein